MFSTSFDTIFVPYLSLLRVSEGVGILYLPSSFLTTDLDLLIGCSATHSLISVFNFMVGTLGGHLGGHVVQDHLLA